ncbi:MAG: trehalase family glycosidase [Bacteroidota bacterium]
MESFSRKQIISQAISLLKSNIIRPENPTDRLNWSERTGPWGKTIENLLTSPEAGAFITPNKNTFVGQWYWDTMGTNTGLLRSDDNELKNIAYSMLRNLFMLYEKTGLIPNAADSVQHSRSQPPFLSTMCLDLAEHLFVPSDSNEITNWYLSSYEYCEREINFPWEAHASEEGFRWFDKVKSEYSGYSPEHTLSYFRPESRSDFRILRSIIQRKLSLDLEEKLNQGYDKIETLILKGLSMLNTHQRKELCEWLYSRRLLVCSGMDFTSSYGIKELPQSLGSVLEPDILSNSDKVFSIIAEVSPVDLNCLIYKYYKDLAFLARKISGFSKPYTKESYKKEALMWEEKMMRLKELIYKVHFDEKTGCFFNYNISMQEKMVEYSHLTHYAYPLFSGIVDKKHATALVERIVDLTTEYGIKLSELKTGYQWDYNMWPLQTWITVRGLLNYGFSREARNIASGYIKCIEKVFNEKQTFFEKYNAENGSTDTDGRYKSEPDFSWGASVYIAMVKEFA